MSVHVERHAVVSRLTEATVVTGPGHIITTPDLSDPSAWCEYHGVSVVDGIATVYKAVDDQYQAGHQYTMTSYEPGSTPSCDDFRANGYCGGGLHFGPTTLHAHAYNIGASRYLSVGVRLDEINVIDGNDHNSQAKCKAPRIVTPCVEVDQYGRPVDRVDAEARA